MDASEEIEGYIILKVQCRQFKGKEKKTNNKQSKMYFGNLP